MRIIRQLLAYHPWSKRPKPYTYVAVRHPRTISWYASEIIAVEAGLIAAGTFLLANVVAEHNRVYTMTEALNGGLNKVMAVTTYLAALFLMSCLVALRFYKLYWGLSVVLSVIALLLAVLGYIEYDNVLVNIPSTE